MNTSTTTSTSARPAAGGRKLQWLKPGIFLGAMVPLVVLLARALTHTIGADPVAIALNQLGLLALILLWASLTATPLKIAFDVKWPIRVRKLLGLLAFFFATLHVLLYSVIDQGFSLDAIGADIYKRPFITVGFVGYVLLIPLAVTSTSGMLKRLGAKRWNRLHRLAYVSAILVAIHFVWRVKRDVSQPATYALVLALLFAVRLWKPMQPRGQQVRSTAR